GGLVSPRLSLLAVADVRREPRRRLPDRVLLCVLPRPPSRAAASPILRDGSLRDTDDLLHRPTRAVRDGQRRSPGPRRRLLRVQRGHRLRIRATWNQLRAQLPTGSVRVSLVGWIAVGVLGGCMAGARFLLDSEISVRARTPFPVGILAVNLLGAFALG